jgi:phosphatidylglycerol:prolipoprotein diacylglycerol transferase
MSGVVAAYAIPATLALLVALFWPVTGHLRSRQERIAYWRLQGITLLGAIAGAKLVVLVADRGWPLVPLAGWDDVLTSGRSIVGGLIFGFLFAEVAKPLLGYRQRPNDRFAAVLPFSIAIGRVGCHLAGCCRGLPHDGALSVTYADGVPRYPVQLFEVAFHLAAGAAFIALVRGGRLEGRVFAVYLMAYGAYRFASEVVRETPRVFASFSAYQAFCVVMIILGAAAFALRTPGRLEHA